MKKVPPFRICGLFCSVFLAGCGSAPQYGQTRMILPKVSDQDLQRQLDKFQQWYSAYQGQGLSVFEDNNLVQCSNGYQMVSDGMGFSSKSGSGSEDVGVVERMKQSSSKAINKKGEYDLRNATAYGNKESCVYFDALNPETYDEQVVNASYGILFNGYNSDVNFYSIAGVDKNGEVEMMQLYDVKLDPKALDDGVIWDKRQLENKKLDVTYASEERFIIITVTNDGLTIKTEVFYQTLPEKGVGYSKLYTDGNLTLMSETKDMAMHGKVTYYGQYYEGGKLEQCYREGNRVEVETCG
ncbi:hypothetical protein [Vibrio barjaei]|uniref:hypothetical protein n=1 Tax=Vibrio barjaei TaxID=1676683 RepID=UPI002283844A|nr:hypothetical protein [Vibrio barjaei]MCY9870451.1 hypothetical protein [Vibrio barjaei]